MDQMAAHGATIQEPQEMAGECDAILMCLPTSVEVTMVTHRILAAGRPGLIVADHSTIQPFVAQRLAEEAGTVGVEFLDAPISGGESGAIAGTLSTMVGGGADAFAALRPIFDTFSSVVTHTGPSGTGQMTKLANQILCAITLMGVAESLSFAKKNGLDLNKTLTVLSGGAGDSWALRNLGPKMIGRDYTPGFSNSLQFKDLGYAMEAAHQCGATTFGLALAHQLCTSQNARGLGDAGIASLFDLYELLNTERDQRA
jgi:3-hydroxyisobutyrate dehydrogenase-like beta-hydroxyacid dehydrogenase